MALSSTLPADVVVGEILADPKLHAEVKALAPVLREAAAPCGSDAVPREMAALFLHFRDKKEEAKAKAFWRPYVKGLSVFPLDALVRGIDDYVQNDQTGFFPNPGPLIAAVSRQAEPIIKAAARATRAANAKPTKPVQVLSVEQRREIAASMLAALKSSRPYGDQ